LLLRFSITYLEILTLSLDFLGVFLAIAENLLLRTQQFGFEYISTQ